MKRVVKAELNDPFDAAQNHRWTSNGINLKFIFEFFFDTAVFGVGD